MKAYFDSCAVDSVIEGPHATDLRARIADGRIEAYVSSDVISELANTPLTKRDRRLRLMSLVGQLLKPVPTNIPIVGGRPTDPAGPIKTRKMVRVIVTSPEGQTMFAALRCIGIRKLDAVHLVEAALAKADVFVTTDIEDILGNCASIKRITNVDVVSPDVLV